MNNNALKIRVVFSLAMLLTFIATVLAVIGINSFAYDYNLVIFATGGIALINISLGMQNENKKMKKVFFSISIVLMFILTVVALIGFINISGNYCYFLFTNLRK